MAGLPARIDRDTSEKAGSVSWLEANLQSKRGPFEENTKRQICGHDGQ